MNTAGEVWHEFKAVIPTEGKYAGHPCAVCMVAGCPMMGKVFHSKNVATHGRPRAPGYRTSVFSRAHDNACEAFIALFTAGAASAEEVGKTVELQLPPPKPPPPPVPLEASEDDDDDAGPAAQSRRRRRQNCAACQGKHRAHTCGRKFQKGSKPSGPRKPRVHKPPSGDAPPRPRAISATQRLLEEAKGLVDEIEEEEEDDGGRRKRPRRAAVAATAAGFADNGAAAAAAAALEDQDEEFSAVLLRDGPPPADELSAV